MVLIIHHDST